VKHVLINHGRDQSGPYNGKSASGRESVPGRGLWNLFARFFLRLLLILLCACLFSPFIAPMRAFAATNDLTVTNQSEQVNYPDGIDFQVTADDTNGNITQATIFIQYVGEIGYQRQQQVKASPPANVVTFNWHDNTSGYYFAPPGTQVSYYWQFLDSAGNEYTDQSQTFTVTDARFNWQHMNQGLVQVHWYNRPASFGQAVMNQASTNIKRIGDDLGGGLSRPINLWVYQSSDDFKGSLPADEHEWVGGIAFPRSNAASIVVDNLDDITLQRDMPHELTHLVFHQLINQGITAPTWFDEGLAVYHQFYHEPEMTLSLKDALAKHTLLRLSTLTSSFPADANLAYQAYAQSWNLVAYMYHTFGQSKMIALIKDMNHPQNDFDQDLQQALGVDQLHLENQWRLSLNQPAILSPADQSLAAHPQTTTVMLTDPQEPLLLSIGTLMIILPALGLGYLFVYQKRSRQRNL